MNQPAQDRRGWSARVIGVMLGAVLVVWAGIGITSSGADDDKDGKNKNQGNHTLRWDTNHPSSSRFTTAFHGAVLDRNTGLVWEQAPEAIRVFDPFDALSYCVNKNVGGTAGWRLPSVVELNSVRDPTLAAPFVPASVFTGVQSTFYWSSSVHTNGFGTFEWTVGFDNGNVVNGAFAHGGHAWCVRGPMQEAIY